VIHVIRVIVVDDSAAFRQALVGFLAGQPAVVVVGQARNGPEAIELTSRIRPDLVFLDFLMPQMDGIAATRALKRLEPPPEVIVCTLVEDDLLREMALAAGADAFVLKRNIVNEIDRLLIGQYSRRRRRSAGWWS
jgi:two-component system, chemotaxis family, protein-glutamate methylesterase/glutaminase